MEKMEQLDGEDLLAQLDQRAQLGQLEHIVDILEEKDRLVGLVLERLDFKEKLASLDQLAQVELLEDRVRVEIKEILVKLGQLDQLDRPARLDQLE